MIDFSCVVWRSRWTPIERNYASPRVAVKKLKVMSRKKKSIEVLAERSRKSMMGKGILGLFFGIILTIIGFLRKEKSAETLKEINTPSRWVEMEILDRAVVLSDTDRIIKHYIALGVDSSCACSVNKYVKDRVCHGSFVVNLDGKEIDSVTKLIHADVDSQWAFHVDNLRGRDFVILIGNNKIRSIITCQPIDSIIYPCVSYLKS